MTDMSLVVSAIMEADEEELSIIGKAVQVRRKALVDARSLINASKMYVGTRVRLIDSIRPKKIASKTGTIIEIQANGKMVVELDYPIDKWRRPVCDPSHLEVI